MDMEGLQEQDAKSLGENKNIVYNDNVSESEQEFLNFVYDTVSSSPTFEEIIHYIDSADIPITIDAVSDPDGVFRFQARFDPHLLETELMMPIEIGNDTTNEVTLIYPDPVVPESTEVYFGEITFNFNVAGTGMSPSQMDYDIALHFFADAMIEEFAHAAQYIFYTSLSNSNVKDDFPLTGNIEAEAITLTGFVLSELNFGTDKNNLIKFGGELQKGMSFDANKFHQIKTEWLQTESTKKFSPYKDAKSDDSPPLLLEKFITK